MIAPPRAAKIRLSVNKLCSNRMWTSKLDIGHSSYSKVFRTCIQIIHLQIQLTQQYRLNRSSKARRVSKLHTVFLRIKVKANLRTKLPICKRWRFQLIINSRNSKFQPNSKWSNFRVSRGLVKRVTSISRLIKSLSNSIVLKEIPMKSWHTAKPILISKSKAIIHTF